MSSFFDAALSLLVTTVLVNVFVSLLSAPKPELDRSLILLLSSGKFLVSMQSFKWAFFFQRLALSHLVDRSLAFGMASTDVRAGE